MTLNNILSKLQTLVKNKKMQSQTRCLCQLNSQSTNQLLFCGASCRPQDLAYAVSSVSLSSFPSSEPSLLIYFLLQRTNAFMNHYFLKSPFTKRFTEPGIVVLNNCNPGTPRVEGGGSQIQGQPEQNRKTASKIKAKLKIIIIKKKYKNN